MKHYQLLATISIDGCLLNLTPESHWVLMAALYSLNDYIDLAGSMTGEKDISLKKSIAISIFVD